MRTVTLAPGHYADDIGGEHLTYDKRYKLMQMVIENPDQPAPIPKYKTARENLEHVVFDAGGFFGGNGGLANPQGGYSDAIVLAKLLITYDRYWPSVQDGEDPFTPQLLASIKASKIPVIAFASTNFGAGWPGQVEAAAKSTGAPDPCLQSLTTGAISTCWRVQSRKAKSSRRPRRGSSSMRSRRILRRCPGAARRDGSAE